MRRTPAGSTRASSASRASKRPSPPVPVLPQLLPRIFAVEGKTLVRIPAIGSSRGVGSTAYRYLARSRQVRRTITRFSDQGLPLIRRSSASRREFHLAPSFFLASLARPAHGGCGRDEASRCSLRRGDPSPAGAHRHCANDVSDEIVGSIRSSSRYRTARWPRSRWR